MLPRLPRKLVSVVHYHQAPGTQPGPYEIPPGMELVELLTGGRGWVESDGEWVEVTPGTLLWHVAGDWTIGRSDPMAPYSCLAVRMQVASSGRRAPRFSVWRESESVMELTEESIRLFFDEGFSKQALLEYLYSKLRYEALLYHHRRESAGTPEPLRLARSLIESRYGEPLKVSELARVAGWSVAHLHDQFRRVYGSTPRQMLLERRLKSAREQLVGTGYSVKQIAANTGFTHSSAFCAAFRRRFGSSPKAYRDAYYRGNG